MRWAWLLLTTMGLALAADDIAAGWWQGQLAKELGGFRLAVHLSRADGGAWTGTLDSPDQGLAGVPLSEVSVVDGTLRCAIRGAQTSFEGKLAADGQTIVGTLTARGTPLPLTFARATGTFVVNRPQEPRPPFPYDIREAQVANADAAGVSLAGTLTVPAGAGPWPAVVLVSGSGPNNRDEEVFGHRPFAVLADHLSRNGVAVLRYDKRGIGGSKGDYAGATTADFASDAGACLRWLRQQPGIAGDRVGLLGHSEGGLVVPVVANRAPGEAAFVVLLGGPAVTGADILTRQTILLSRTQGVDDTALAAIEKAHRALVKRAAEGASAEELRPLVKALMAAQGSPADDKTADAVAGGLLSPWMKGFLTYDPAPALRGLKVPVLALTGELDLQVEPGQNLPVMVAAFEAGGVRDYTVSKVGGVNHLLQPARTGGVDEYAKVEMTTEPRVLAQISAWILSRTAR